MKRVRPSFLAYYYDREHLSEETEDFLIEEGFTLGKHEEKLWFCKMAVITYCLEKDDSLPENLKEIPKNWWKRLKLKPALQKQIEAIFKENPENLVIFCHAGDELLD